eukprot:GHVS01065414.1.p1 GENE.GHVS01065414.1~~GHVS01065414.1.p1  ORF type:complete len:124 (-),score=25.06 GHVS01065414.1:155-526(-)
MGSVMTIAKAVAGGEMDFVGQDLAYKVQSWIIWPAAVIGFIIGLYYQRYLYTFLCIAAASVVAALICIPSWPIYSAARIEWAEPRRPAVESQEEEENNEETSEAEDQTTTTRRRSTTNRTSKR